MFNERQQAILQIIEQQEICTQQELLEKLRAVGMSVTQATVSRDIQLLGLVKGRTTQGKNKYLLPPAYQNPSNEEDHRLSLQAMMRDAVREIDEARNIVVLKCKEGFAGAVCTAFDAVAFAGVVGTLAGDNTFFVLMRTAEQTEKLLHELRRWMK